jgi:hypothetical protein
VRNGVRAYFIVSELCAITFYVYVIGSLKSKMRRDASDANEKIALYDTDARAGTHNARKLCKSKSCDKGGKKKKKKA